MARRRKKQGSMGNLDSLLDTMTSVVGILIIILIVIQLGVKEKVKELLDIVNEEISLIDLEKKEQNIKTLEKLIQKREQEFMKKNQAQLSAMNKLNLAKTQVVKAREELTKIQNIKANPISITKDINAALKEIKAKEKELQSIELEENKLKKLLASAKRIKSQPDKTVKLPNPRPAPPGARGIYFICSAGRVFYRNDNEYREYFQKKVENTRAKKNKNGEYDPAYLKKYFSTRSNITPFGKFEFHNNKTNIYFRLKFGRSVGELSSFITRSSSRYQRELSKLDNKKYYIVFQVQPDSYATYLTARAVAEKLGFACGWQPQGKNEWDFTLWTPMKVLGAAKILAQRKKNPPSKKPSNILD